MKKIILTSICMLVGSSFALAGTGKASTKKKGESPKNEKKTEFCSVSCSKTIANPQTGVNMTFTMSAGNMFTSCASAQQKCDKKMMATFGTHPDSYEL
ncbi:hypothetical protein ACI513_03620 [Chryseobacterium sp. M5]|uniref:hypothetical protein n=1 Tax=Chryseobacterium sp. M5 TaxID=3379128 RepID=UPI003857C208